MEYERKGSLENIFNVQVKSIEEYEKLLNISWPTLPDDITLPEYEIENIFGTIEEVEKMLEPDALKSNKMYDEIDQRVQNMDKYMDIYKSELFTDEKRISKIKANRFYVPEKFFMTEAEMLTKALEDDKGMTNTQRRRKKLMDEKQKKRLENVLYIGFRHNELSDLPGFLEPPHLLNSVSTSMGFSPSFLRFWSPIIRSEASNAILLDSFWWFYLHCFKKDASLEEDKVLYFSRVADSFVALFLSVDATMRDKFFNIYPNFLAQAIYLAFYKAFADSRLQFNDDFKQEICDTIHEWVLGVKPIPESFRDWKITVDSNVAMTNADGKVVSTVELMQKIGNLEKMLKTLGTDDEASKPNTAAVKTTMSKRTDHSERKYRDNADEILTKFYDRKIKKSHTVGRGAVMEKVLFNLKGQSILISHYLNMHNLQESEPQGHKMSRTQIAHQPPSNAPTYRDVVYESMERTKSLEFEFEKISKQTGDEIKKIEKARRKLVLEREKSNTSIGSKKKRNKDRSKEENKSSRQFEDETKVSRDFNEQKEIEFKENPDEYDDARSSSSDSNEKFYE